MGCGEGREARDRRGVCIIMADLCCIAETMEKTMAPHSSTLAWKIPWMEEPGGLQSMGLSDFTFTFHFGEGNGNPLQCSCLENPRDGKPGGLPSMGSHRVGHD